MAGLPDSDLESWYAALEARHLATLTSPEVRRALQALSSLYVERRDRLPRGAALDGAGKRAAFALFYGPLHFAVVRRIVSELHAADRGLARIVDLGCGTGAAGAAWALETGRHAGVNGVDTAGWAIAEAAWNFRALGIRGTAQRGDVSSARLGGGDEGIVAAYTVNELDDAARDALLPRLLAAHGAGSRVLVVEPIANRPVPFWGTWEAAFREAGGRADLWRFAASLPSRMKLLDKAAGLRHQVLTARSLWLPAQGR